MDQQDNQAIQSLQSIIDKEAKKQLGDEASEKVKEAILEKVFTRIAHVFTAEDAAELDRLVKEDTTGDTVKYFVLSRLPHFDDILKEEIRGFMQRGK